MHRLTLLIYLQHAANSKNFELCQLFLSLGLKDALLERAGESGQ